MQNIRWLRSSNLRLRCFRSISPSLLDFKQQTSSEQNNLRWIYLIEGEIPCDNQMRVILDNLEPKEIRLGLRLCFSTIEPSRSHQRVSLLGSKGDYFD